VLQEAVQDPASEHRSPARDNIFITVDHQENLTMNFSNLLHWAIIFLVVALVAAFLGFGGVAGTAMQGAKLLFWVAIVLAIVAFVVSLVRKS
jgi:uncharacterized membrane protein YtjA (UPF0391 family)